MAPAVTGTSARSCASPAPFRRPIQVNSFRGLPPPPLPNRKTFDQILHDIDNEFGVPVKRDLYGTFTFEIHSTIYDNVKWLYDNAYDALIRCLDSTPKHLGRRQDYDLSQALERAKKDSAAVLKAAGQKTSKSFAGVSGNYARPRPTSPSPVVPAKPAAVSAPTTFSSQSTLVNTPPSSQTSRVDAADDWQDPDAHDLLCRPAPRPEPQGSGEEWYIYSLAEDTRLFAEEIDPVLTPSLYKAPFAVRHECMRTALACDKPLKTFDLLTKQSWTTYQQLRSTLRAITAHDLPAPMGQQAWDAAMNCNSPENANFQMLARLEPVKVPHTYRFAIRLLPLQHISNSGTRRLHRKFGAHRFLTVKVADTKLGPTYFQRLIDWACQENKKFLGNKWTVFKMRHHTRNSRLGKQGPESIDVFEFLFFATSGPGLRSISISEFLHWSINIKHRSVMSMSYAKAYARIDLNLTTTFPTLRFKSEQILLVRDQTADGTQEETMFDNNAKDWSKVNIFNPNDDDREQEVMNDGCARMSLKAGQLVWDSLGYKGHPPSAFQGRLGGAKGMWIVDNADNETVWIQVSDSQLKYARHADEDSHQTTLDVLSWTKPTTPSKIYRDFIPIIHAGGIQRSNFKDYISKALDFEDEDIRASLDEPARLVKWLETRCTTSDALDAENRQWPGGRHPNQLRLMVESGFHPAANLHAYWCLDETVQRLYDKHCAELSLGSDFSTSLYGVADPEGCLLPGEVHICLSTQVEQPSQRPSHIFHDLEALVGRNPAIRASDVQKVRLVYKPELKHLVDVAVFSVKGMYPLAKKLQGGDYDGDQFIFIWDPKLVNDFRNSPPPPLKHAPTPDHYGINKDSRTLKQVLQNGGIMSWMRQCMQLQMKEQFLGKVTNFHSRLAYKLEIKTLDGPALEAVSDLHDFLVDTEKNGYSFEQEEWLRFEQKFVHPYLPPGLRKSLSLPEFRPEYKRIKPKGSEISDLFTLIADDSKPLPENHIMDYLIFHVAGPIARRKYESLIADVKAQGPVDRDADIEKLFLELQEEYAHSEDEQVKQVAALLDELESTMETKVLSRWNPGLVREITDERKKRTKFDEMRKACATAFQNIPKPDEVNLLFREWARESFGHCSVWDMIKTSCLYYCAVTHRKGQHRLSTAFDLAGIEFCLLKSLSSSKGMPTPLIPDVAAYRKMRRPPALAEKWFDPATSFDADGEGGFKDADGDVSMLDPDVGGYDSISELTESQRGELVDSQFSLPTRLRGD